MIPVARTLLLVVTAAGVLAAPTRAQHPRRLNGGLHIGRSNVEDNGAWVGGVQVGVPVRALVLAGSWTRHWQHAAGQSLWSANMALLLAPRFTPLYLGGGVQVRRVGTGPVSENQWAPVGILGVEFGAGRFWPRLQLEASDATPGGLLFLGTVGLSLGL
jgi:hypothetical protein